MKPRGQSSGYSVRRPLPGSRILNGGAATLKRMSKAVLGLVAGVALAVSGFSGAGMAHPSKTPHEAHQNIQGPKVSGQIQWGVWVDDDGCMHWWADGGL